MNLERRIEALEKQNGSNRTFLVWEGNADSLAYAQAQFRPEQYSVDRLL
jgi:hypothetical protein